MRFLGKKISLKGRRRTRKASSAATEHDGAENDDLIQLPRLPFVTLVHILSFLNDRKSYNNMSQISKEMWQTARQSYSMNHLSIPPPWPCRRFLRKEGKSLRRASWVTCALFSPNDQCLAVAANTIRLWNRNSGRIAPSGISTLATATSLALAFCGQGQYLVTSSVHFLTLWNLKEGTVQYQSQVDNCISHMFISSSDPSLHVLATWGFDGVVHLWTIPSNCSKIQHQLHFVADESSDGMSLDTVAISPCGLYLASARNKYFLQIHRLKVAVHATDGNVWGQNETTQLGLEPVVTLGMENRITVIRFSPDGKTILVGFENGCLCFVKTSDWTTDWSPSLLFNFVVVKKGKCITCIDIHKDKVVIGCGSKIYLYNWTLNDFNAQFNLLDVLLGHSDRVESVTFSSQGHNLVSCGDKSFIIWDMYSTTKNLIKKSSL